MSGGLCLVSLSGALSKFLLSHQHSHPSPFSAVAPRNQRFSQPRLLCRRVWWKVPKEPPWHVGHRAMGQGTCVKGWLVQWAWLEGVGVTCSTLPGLPPPAQRDDTLHVTVYPISQVWLPGVGGDLITGCIRSAHGIKGWEQGTVLQCMLEYGTLYGRSP